MNPISIVGFAGAALAPNPRILAPSMGVDIENAEVGVGELRPLKDRVTVATVPTGSQQLTIYRMGRDTASDSSFWLSWPTVVNVALRLDGGVDSTERTYYTGDGVPKWTNNVIGLGGGPPYPQAARLLSVPQPLVAPTVVLTTDGTGTPGPRTYVETFVNDLGWESAPSPVSTPITVMPDGAIVDLSALNTAPAGLYGITLRRIYVTQPTSTDAAAPFLFLVQLAIGTTAFTDTGQPRQDPIATIGAIPVPDDAANLIGLWNGMAAFTSGKTVSFITPEQPYNAPVAFDQPMQDTPVALAAWEQNLFVLTTGQSVLLQGQDPTSMSEIPSFAGVSCATSRAVVTFNHGVVWASEEGLGYSGINGLLTEGLIKPKQWRAMVPTSMVAGRYGRLYVCSFTVGGVKRGFMIDPLHPDSIWFLSSGFDACFYDPLVDALFVLEGGNVRKFDANEGVNLTTSFTSKTFHQPMPRNFGWLKVIADVYPVTVAVKTETIDRATGVVTFPVTRATLTVPSDAPVRLPAGYTAEDWQVVASATGPVQAIHLATEISDLRAV